MTEAAPPTRLWGGRFSGGPADALARLSMSVHFDWRLAPYDLLGVARARPGAARRRPARRRRAEPAARRARRARQRRARGPVPADADDEDVHTALERGLLERVGALGGKLRAGRSRNDQVATDLRLYLRDHVRQIAGADRRARDRADRAGRAHDRRAVAGPDAHAARAAGAVRAPAAGARPGLRPRRLAARRLGPADRRSARSAPARWPGRRCRSTRRRSPRSSGFARAAANSIDAVSDRDFAAEFLFCAALIGVHLSRLGEEVVLWATSEFRWVELDDSFSTGSSIMPQKKNPDVAELARGKAGRLIGDLTALLVVLKGLPLAYDRDLQEDKEPVFDAVDTLLLVLPAVSRHGRDDDGRHRPAGGHRGRRVRTRHRRGGVPGAPGGRVPRRARGGRPAGGLVRAARLRPRRGLRCRPGVDQRAPDPGRPRRACR